MKYCSNCGASSPDDAKFCVECGAKLLIKGQAPVSQQKTGAVKKNGPSEDEYNAWLKNEYKKQKQKEKDEEDRKTGMRWFKIIGWVIVIIFALRFCGGSNSSSYSSSSSSSSSSSHRASEHFLTDAEAFTCAEEIVKANLESPSTAKFCKIYEATIKYMGDGRYKVSGYVDAQNSYGATVRGDFVVHFTEVYDGKDIGYKEGTCYIENR